MKQEPTIAPACYLIHKISMKTHHLLFMLLFGFCFFSPVANIAQDKNEVEKGIPVDTAKYIFFLDKKRASASSTLYKMHEPTVILKVGYGNPRDAIFLFGEKARNGIMIFESNNKPKQIQSK